MLVLAALLLSQTSICLAADYQQPNDFVIEYIVENNILTAGKATYRLKKQQGSSFELSFETQPSGVFRLTRKGRILDESQVSIGDGQLRSHVYTHTDLSEPIRSFRIDFDQTKNRGNITTADKTSAIEYPATTLDRLSMILQLMLRLNHEPDVQSFSVPILEKNKVRKVTFHQLAAQSLDTVVGTVSTTVLKKSRLNSNRHELIWFAKLADNALPFPIQFEQYRQNSLVVRLKLQSLHFP